MKSSGHIFLVHPSNPKVELPQRVMRLLGMQPDSAEGSEATLHCLFLKPRPADDSSRYPMPTAVIVATPIPMTAWGRLIRASFTTPSEPGALHALLDALLNVDTFAHVMESSEGLELSQYGIGPDEKTEGNPRRSTLPPVFAILEFPRKEAGGTDVNKKLRQKLEDLIASEMTRVDSSSQISLYDRADECERNQAARSDLQRLLREQLSGAYGDKARRFGVDWVSNMRVLNSLHFEAVERSANRGKVDSGDLGTAGSPLRQARIKANIHPDPASGRYILDLEQWRALLWDTRDNVEAAMLHAGDDLAVVVGADSDELAMTMQFFDLKKHVVVSFEVVVPSSGLEHLWWRWVCDEVSSAGGNIVASGSWGRLAGGWGILHVTAAFTLDRQEMLAGGQLTPGKDDVGRFIQCIRSLKGASALELRGPSDRFKRLKSDLGPDAAAAMSPEQRSTERDESLRRKITLKLLGSAAGLKEAGLRARTDSTLRRVRILHKGPEHLPRSGYLARFGRNPFDFTTPLSFSTYRALHDTSVFKGFETRLRLADRIAGILSDPHGQSVILVGAHRTGKTSVMNMVVDVLSGRVDSEVLEGAAASDEVQPDRGVLLHSNRRQVKLRAAAQILNGENRWLAHLKVSGTNLVARHFDRVRKALSVTQERDDGGEEQAIDVNDIVAVRVNAATTPPHLIFVEIVRQLMLSAQVPSSASRLSLAPDGDSGLDVKVGTDVGSVLTLMTMIAAAISGALPMAVISGLGLAMVVEEPVREILSKVGVEVSGGGKKEKSTLSGRMDDTLRSSYDTPEGRAAVLRESLELLGAVVEVAKHPALFGPGFRLVVAVDEVVDSAAWGADWAFPCWRHVVESPRFHSVRWLFSSSKPLAEATAYSPLGNAVREYNMQSLRGVEAESMVRAFERKPRSEEDDRDFPTPDGPATQNLPAAWRLRPTVTFGAQHLIRWVTGQLPYLMQVTCCLLFDASSRGDGVGVLTEEFAARHIKERVLPEVSDYFESQWRLFDDDQVQETLLRAIGPIKDSFSMHRYGTGSLPLPPLGPKVRKALSRSGVAGDPVRCPVIPLFIEWLQSRFEVDSGPLDRGNAPAESARTRVG